MAGKKANLFRRLREAQMLSKTELARKAGLSLLTIDRVERGKSCRISTQRKILAALGLSPSEAAPLLEGAGEIMDVRKLPPGALMMRGDQGADARGQFPGLKVMLLVDDDWMREVLTERLQYWGCKVEAAMSREEAVERYPEVRPQLVLMDLGAAGKEAFDTSQRIVEQDPDAAILLLTGPSDASMARKALREGVVKVVISKPFYLEQLLLAIQEAIRKPKPQPALPSKREVVA
jgi:CheY-like chemotaxis protein/DNA-binding XRE family transcriptional regulator